MTNGFDKEVGEALMTFSERQKLLMQKSGKKLSIGHERRQGWSGALPFYLFWCEACKHFSKDYPHGHIERQYLLCSHCREHHDFVPWWADIAAFWQRVRFHS